ncbi:hypothetical protein ACHAWF_001122, partial [Thalassiosira exigua]
MDSSGPFVSTENVSTLTETIVLQGKMQANFDITNDSSNDVTMEKDCKLNAERIEIYTAQGADLLYPVQILEPAKLAIFYYEKAGNKNEPTVSYVKIETSTPIYLAVSMQNAALASALASSISDSFSADKGGVVDAQD